MFENNYENTPISTIYFLSKLHYNSSEIGQSITNSCISISPSIAYYLFWNGNIFLQKPRFSNFFFRFNILFLQKLLVNISWIWTKNLHLTYIERLKSLISTYFFCNKLQTKICWICYQLRVNWEHRFNL